MDIEVDIFRAAQQDYIPNEAETGTTLSAQITSAV